ncbi:glycosyltransferase family 2 protein [Glaciihabitans sp. dw_435]|uniref:glycosyltransferase family 2 protein n=1 Tax=Glaciihabitans sp. dw_435 TaxID=2720081 RepID=UPI001BD5C059|nr:glycosyltransferase family 2 protein [Glaciihabitans sp. dw_435]
MAILVVAYHSSSEIAGLVESLVTAASLDNTVDIHVIDNSRDAGEIERLSAMTELASFIPSTENLGYGAGMNALAASLTREYDWLLICNPDVRFTPGSLDELMAAPARHPLGALFGPQIVGEDGIFYPSARSFPSIRTGVGHALLANIWPTNPWTLRYHRQGNATATTDTEVDWLSGACVLVRPAAFAEVSGFDEGYFMYFEDVDLGWRLSKRGWQSIYVPAARIVHSGGQSTKRQATAMRAVHHRSAERYLSRKYSAWYLAPLRVGLRFALFVRRDFFRR